MRVMPGKNWNLRLAVLSLHEKKPQTTYHLLTEFKNCLRKLKIMSKKDQIERIRQMELRMERAARAVMELSAALENYEAVQEDITALEQYYGSEAWKQDYADDEAGLLPNNLRRGVLSEDGIWNLLSDASELNKRIERL